MRSLPDTSTHPEQYLVIYPVNNLRQQMSVWRQSNVSSTLNWRWTDVRLTSANVDCLLGMSPYMPHTFAVDVLAPFFFVNGLTKIHLLDLLALMANNWRGTFLKYRETPKHNIISDKAGKTTLTLPKSEPAQNGQLGEPINTEMSISSVGRSNEMVILKEWCNFVALFLIKFMFYYILISSIYYQCLLAFKIYISFQQFERQTKWIFQILPMAAICMSQTTIFYICRQWWKDLLCCKYATMNKYLCMRNVHRSHALTNKQYTIWNSFPYVQSPT